MLYWSNRAQRRGHGGGVAAVEAAVLRDAQQQLSAGAAGVQAIQSGGQTGTGLSLIHICIGDRLVTEKDGTAWVCYLRD